MKRIFAAGGDDHGFLREMTSVEIFCHDLLVHDLISFIADELNIFLQPFGRLTADE